MNRRGRVLLATRSAGKLRELAPMLAAHGWDAVDLDTAGIDERPDEEDALEVAVTFAENALAKARYFHARSGLPTLSDDSGLEVEALGGEPGVRSKRWSERPDLSGLALDAANNARLLAALDGAGSRAARYVCAAAWVDGSGEAVALGGTAGGSSRWPEAREDSGDPLFFSDDSASFGVVVRGEGASESSRAGRGGVVADCWRRS